jgi:hypothetical protein
MSSFLLDGSMNHVTGLFLILILRHTLPFRREHPFHVIQPEFEDALIMEKEYRIGRLDDGRILGVWRRLISSW